MGADVGAEKSGGGGGGEAAGGKVSGAGHGGGRRQATTALQQAAAASTEEKSAHSRGMTNGVCSSGSRSVTVGRGKTERGASSRHTRRSRRRASGSRDDDAHAAGDDHECGC